MTLEALIALVPTLKRPVVLLEDGRGRTGRARLAWGARRRVRLDWTSAHCGDLAWLGSVAAGSRAYGVLAYDVGLPPRASRRLPAIAQPLADFFEPEHEVILDRSTGEMVGGVAGTGGDGRSVGAGQAGVTAGPAGPARLLGRSFTQPEFESAVRAVKAHIAAGDVYQVNLAVTERYQVSVAPWAAYLRLRAINPSPWMGFADLGDWQVVSGSPELLVEVEDRRAGGGSPGGRGPAEPSRPNSVESPGLLARTRPIAGTRKRAGDVVTDAAMRAELALDQKEQAEHRMLLDLARNDLGRVCSYGTVEVHEREVIEEYSHVFHLVSEVTGRLAAGRAAWEAVAAMFPGGTITGAPKIRAMEVIAELEPVARGAYTGGLGWIGPDGLQLNILIRSAVMRDGQALVQAGSGIVWDSDPSREWREAVRKGAAVRAALGVPEP